MREEAISSRAPTPAASSAGASSPLGPGQSSKAGSLSRIGGSQPRPSLSTCATGSTLGSSQPSCRPWERGDLLRRLSTFTPSNWFGKPKAASSLACARRGWVNIDVDKIECESCEANLTFLSTVPLTAAPEDDIAVEDFVRQLDTGHKVTCPWKGNNCAESLVQFPPTPALALIGGFKDRCDGLLLFPSLPVVSASAIELMRISRGPEIDRLLRHSQSFVAGESNFKAENISEMETFGVEAFCIYSRAQKLISLCGWEPRWLPNVQDCEEHSAQSARNGGSTGPTKNDDFGGAGPSNKAFSSSTKKGPKKKTESKCESRSPLLDCSLCGATVKIWDFLTVPRPARYGPNIVDIPESSKKMALTRGVSAASGICGWVMEDHDEAKSQSNAGLDLSLTMAGGLDSKPLHHLLRPEQYQDVDMGRDLIIGQPASSEVGDRAASYESRGPSTRKRNIEEGGSTVDRPHLLLHQADSVEGTVVDRDGDEVDDVGEYSAGPSKRARDFDAYETYNSSYRRDPFGAGPSHSRGLDIERENMGGPSTRDSTHVSSVIAMDTICHHGDDDSMESVENNPGDMDDVHFPSSSKNPDLNEMSEMNYSNQAQQSTCAAAVRVVSEMDGSSTNDEEVLDTYTANAHGRGVPSFGISGGSVGMGASHEAEIHGTDVSVHRTDSGAGDVEPVAEVTENQGQTGEFAENQGLMGDFVPEEMDQDLMSRSVGRTDSGSKIVGSVKAVSSESGERTINMNNLPQENSAHPSLSCNAVVCSGYEASKDEVTQGRKASSPTEDGPYQQSGYLVANGLPNGQSNYEEQVEFDPIKSHNCYCPWVNGNVAAAGCVSSSTSSASDAVGVALSGWQLTLDAFQTIGKILNQTVESESAASLYKNDATPSRKLLPHHSFSKSSFSKSHGKANS